jgi:hypothetical protein
LHAALFGSVGPNEPVFYDLEMIEIIKWDPEEEARKEKKQGRTSLEHFNSMDADSDKRVSKV